MGVAESSTGITSTVTISANILIILLLFIYLFIIQAGRVKAMWPSLPLNQALNKLTYTVDLHTQ